MKALLAFSSCVLLTLLAQTAEAQDASCIALRNIPGITYVKCSAGRPLSLSGQTPGGQLFRFDFSYKTEGKPADAVRMNGGPWISLGIDSHQPQSTLAYGAILQALKDKPELKGKSEDLVLCDSGEVRVKKAGDLRDATCASEEKQAIFTDYWGNTCNDSGCATDASGDNPSVSYEIPPRSDIDRTDIEQQLQCERARNDFIGACSNRLAFYSAVCGLLGLPLGEVAGAVCISGETGVYFECISQAPTC